MTPARDEVLARIRAALVDRPDPAPVTRSYRAADTIAPSVELLIDRLVNYKATVHTSGTPADVLRGRGLKRVVIPDGLPTALEPTGTEIVREPVDVATLDSVGAVITTCAVAVAETGTIILDAGPGMGPRALTLVPDYHLVVVRRSQVVAGVPDAIAALDPSRPLTWISGPSATSDIELKRVEGVHGPRTLDVLIIG